MCTTWWNASARSGLTFLMTHLLVPASTFLLSCMKENRLFVFRNPCFPPRGCDWVKFNGSLFFFSSRMKDKKSLFSHWHATVCQWLTHRRTVQWHVDLLSLSSKKSSSSTSLPLIWSGLPVICSVDTNHTVFLKRVHQDFWRKHSLLAQKPKKPCVPGRLLLPVLHANNVILLKWVTEG